MEIFLLYGPGEIAKRTAILKTKKQFTPASVTAIDFKEAGEKGLELSLVSRSLFESGSRLVVVENVPEKFDLGQVKQPEENLTLLLVAGNLKSTSVLLQSAKAAKVVLQSFEGEGERLVFPFLDALIERKPQTFVELEKLLSEHGGIYILTMVYYLLRRNLLPLPPSAFVQKKIKTQKSLYQEEDWVRLYRLTLETEFKIKSGALPEKEALVIFTEKVLSGQIEC